MDEKTIRTTRAKVYIGFAVLSLILALILSGTPRRIALAACAVYSLIMAWWNFHKAKQEDQGKK